MFLDNLKYKVTYMESSADNERYKNNIRVVNYVTKTVPRIASGGVIVLRDSKTQDEEVEYVSNNVMHLIHDVKYKDLFTKRELLELLKLVNNMIAKFDHFKSEIDKDIAAGDAVLELTKKIAKEFGTGGDTRSKRKVIHASTVLVPKVANANIINYFTIAKDVVWLLNVNYRMLKNLEA